MTAPSLAQQAEACEFAADNVWGYSLDWHTTEANLRTAAATLRALAAPPSDGLVAEIDQTLAREDDWPPEAIDDVLQRARDRIAAQWDYIKQQGEDMGKLSAALAARDAKVAEWQKVTAYDTPESCHTGIKTMYGNWQTALQRAESVEREAAALRELLKDAQCPNAYKQTLHADKSKRSECEWCNARSAALAARQPSAQGG